MRREQRRLIGDLVNPLRRPASPQTANPRLPREGGFTLIEILVAMVILLVGILGTYALLDAANRQTSANLAREQGNSLAQAVLERARAIPYDGLTADRAPVEQIARRFAADAPPDASTFSLTRRGVHYTVEPSVCEIDDDADGVGIRDPATFCAVGPDGPQDGDWGAGGTQDKVYANVTLPGVKLDLNLKGSVGDVVCDLLGSGQGLSALLGGTVNGLVKLVGGGANVSLCSASSTGRVGVDHDSDDFKRVSALVTWRTHGRPEHVRQTTLIPNPAKGAP
jgi:prepilin-type N-terminal cleavage/methylation domain-containing protein